MIEKTEAIVLNKISYTDNKKIVTLFSKSSGKKKLVVTFSKSKKNKNNYFQIFQILNVEFSAKNNSEFISLKESSLNTPLNGIWSNYDKLSIVFFISGMLNNIIYNNLIDEELYNFVKMSIILLEKCEHPANFHIAFLVNLAKYIGIMPINNFSKTEKFFDFRKGRFIALFDKNFTLNLKESENLHNFLNEGMSGFVKINLNKKNRNDLISGILNFYRFHFPNIDTSSYEILKEMYK